MTAKEHFQRVLASLGVISVTLTAEPKIVQGLDITARFVKALPYSNVQVNKDESFLKAAKEALNRNKDYTSAEKESIYEDFCGFYADWGYLLNSVGKRNILYQLEYTHIKRGAKLPKWASGTYGIGTIRTVGKSENSTVLKHEAAHSISDHGFLVGPINGYSTGYALNEGINASVTEKYYGGDTSYYIQRRDVINLSLLVGNEVIMDCYLNGDIDKLVNAIIENCPGINKLQVYKYFWYMDIINECGYQEKEVPKVISSGKEELYNEMFKSKFGYDYNLCKKRILGNCTFFDDEYKVILPQYSQVEVKVKKEELSVLNNQLDLNDRVSRVINDQFIELIDLLTISHDQSKRALAFDGNLEILEEIASFYSDSDKALRVLTVICNNINNNNNNYSDNFLDDYVSLLIEKASNISSDPIFLASFLRKNNTSLNGILYPLSIDNAIKKQLQLLDDQDLLYYYYNTDISFKKFELNDDDKWEYEFEDKYIGQIEITNYEIKNNTIVLSEDHDYYIEYAVFYDGVKYDDMYFSYEPIYEGSGEYPCLKFTSSSVENIDYSKLKVVAYQEMVLNSNKSR